MVTVEAMQLSLPLQTLLVPLSGLKYQLSHTRTNIPEAVCYQSTRVPAIISLAQHCCSFSLISLMFSFIMLLCIFRMVLLAPVLVFAIYICITSSSSLNNSVILLSIIHLFCFAFFFLILSIIEPIKDTIIITQHNEKKTTIELLELLNRLRGWNIKI